MKLKIKIVLYVSSRNEWICIPLVKLFVTETHNKALLKIATRISGIESVTLIRGNDKCEIEVVGDGVDAEYFAVLLRKKIGHAEILSISVVGEKKAEELASKVQQKVWPPYNCKCKCCDSRTLFQRTRDEDQLLEFLRGLNRDYEHARNQILQMDPLPSVTRACSMLLEIEKQKGSDHASCSKQHISGSTNKNNMRSVKAREDKSNLYCDYCNRKKHDRSTCFRLHGYPEWWTGPKKTGSPTKLLLTHEPQT